MTPDIIDAWVASGESENQEFKESTGQRRIASQALCAMLNQRGGRVLFGVSDAGEVRGQEMGNDTLEDISQEIKEIDPPVYPRVHPVELGNGRHVIVVSVDSGQTKPYTHRNRAYKRVGSATHEITKDEYNRMLVERLHHEARVGEPARQRMDGR